jgi:hypothetical protein
MARQAGSLSEKFAGAAWPDVPSEFIDLNQCEVRSLAASTGAPRNRNISIAAPQIVKFIPTLPHAGQEICDQNDDNGHITLYNAQTL